MELSGTSEAARKAFGRAIRLLSRCSSAAAAGTSGTDVKAVLTRGEEDRQTCLKASGNGAKAAEGSHEHTTEGVNATESSAGGHSASEIDEGLAAAQSSCTAMVVAPESRLVASAEAPSKEGEGTGGVAAPVDPVPEGSDAGDPQQASQSPATPSDTAIHRPVVGGGSIGVAYEGDGKAASQPPISSPREEAISAMTAVMRGLESRFVVHTTSSAPLINVDLSQDIGTTPSAKEEGVGRDVGQSTGSSSRPSREGTGWTVRVRPSRAEELLVDLLEREKACFPQINKDGARALERWTISSSGKDKDDNDEVSASSSASSADEAMFFFIAPAMAMSTTPIQVALEAARANEGAATSENPKGVTTAAVPAAAADSRSSEGLTAAELDPNPAEKGVGTTAATMSVREQKFLQQRRHVPLEISAPGLGEKASVFSMMLRGAVLLGQYETAILLAVRCTEHFLDTVEMLASPRGPLGGSGGGGGGGTGSPSPMRRSGGGKGAAAGRDLGRNEGLGVVSLLLTSRDAGADRRTIDTATASACAEFLAHALTVAVWAVPFVLRVELFGSGGGDDVHERDTGDRTGRAGVRRASVLRCLARLMKHSMDTDNTRVSAAMMSALLNAFRPPLQEESFLHGGCVLNGVRRALFLGRIFDALSRLPRTLVARLASPQNAVIVERKIFPLRPSWEVVEV